MWDMSTGRHLLSPVAVASDRMVDIDLPGYVTGLARKRPPQESDGLELKYSGLARYNRRRHGVGWPELEYSGLARYIDSAAGVGCLETSLGTIDGGME